MIELFLLSNLVTPPALISTAYNPDIPGSTGPTNPSPPEGVEPPVVRSSKTSTSDCEQDNTKPGCGQTDRQD